MMCSAICNLVSAANIFAGFFVAVLFVFYYFCGNKTPGKAAA